jgi:hypothetical protein
MKENKLKCGLNLKKPEKKFIKQVSDDEDEEEEIDYKAEINKNIKRQQEYNANLVNYNNISSQMT